MLRRLNPHISSALSRELNDLVADCCELIRSCLASVYFNLREISLAFVLVFFGYCYSQDRATRSWAETSRIGFKEQGFCESGGRTYGVIDESILVDGVMLYRGPLVLDLSGASGPSTCFSQQDRQLCGNSFGYAGGPFKELTVESLTKQFNQVVSKPVLNNSPWILASSVVNLCANLLLKSNNLFDDLGVRSPHSCPTSTFPRVFHQRRDRNHRTAVRVAAITTAVDDDIESRIPFHESY